MTRSMKECLGPLNLISEQLKWNQMVRMLILSPSVDAYFMKLAPEVFWLLIKSKEAKDEVQRDNQFSSTSSVLHPGTDLWAKL